MPRFYFDFHDGRACHDDHVGCELPDLHAARTIAARAVSELRKQDGTNGRSFAGCGFVIESEEHEVLIVVPFDATGPRS